MSLAKITIDLLVADGHVVTTHEHVALLIGVHAADGLVVTALDHVTALVGGHGADGPVIVAQEHVTPLVGVQVHVTDGLMVTAQSHEHLRLDFSDLQNAASNYSSHNLLSNVPEI